MPRSKIKTSSGYETPFATRLRELIDEAGIDGRFVAVSDNFTTPAYCKPLRKGISDTVYEDPRLDFENRAVLSKNDEEALIANIKKMSELVDVIAVSDQFKFGVVTENVRACISELAKKKTVIVDSRDRISLYSNVIAKPNEVELYRVFNPNSLVQSVGDKDIVKLGGELQKRNRRPLIVTVGSRGAFLFNEGSCELIPTVKEEPPVDIVGAGDTFLSSVAAGLASGTDLRECIETGHLASGVTVKKLNMTGTASQAEILTKYTERNKNSVEC